MIDSALELLIGAALCIQNYYIKKEVKANIAKKTKRVSLTDDTDFVPCLGARSPTAFELTLPTLALLFGIDEVEVT